jgi:glycosyltransferase involved in cell wall biosynthesis
MSIEFSIIIPTYNRFDELFITLPQVAAQLSEKSELIIIDQSNIEALQGFKSQFEEVMAGCNFRIIHSATPSLPLAWNTGVALAKGRIIMVLDDDVDFDFDIIEAHSKYFDDPLVCGVAGSYYASTKNSKWTPSSKNGVATSLASVNMSFLKTSFQAVGGATTFIKPFAAIDWELGEVVNKKIGKIVVGDDCAVLHRAPADGGCANQGERGETWYYGAYHNHTVWILSRSFPEIITKLPRHIYWLIKYCMPKNKVNFFKPNFIKNAVIKGVMAGMNTHRSNKRKRIATISDDDQLTLITEGLSDNT